MTPAGSAGEPVLPCLVLASQFRLVSFAAFIISVSVTGSVVAGILLEFLLQAGQERYWKVCQ